MNIKVIRACKAVLLVLLVLMVAPHFFKPKNSDAPFEQVVSQTMQDIDQNVYPQRDNQAIKRYLGLEPASYENIAFYRTEDAMNASELVIVRFRDDTQAAPFEEAVNKRMESQKKIYQGYAPEQEHLVKEGRVDIEANYALYVVGPQARAIDKQFKESLR